MPSGPRRFGCGEIATGFKPGGFPPGFFNPSRIIPRPRSTGGPGGGNGGGGGEKPWKCIETPDTCVNKYGINWECKRAVGPNTPCISTVKCEELAVGECDPGVDPNCFETEEDCRASIGQTGCREVDDCVEKTAMPEYHCYEQQIPCTGYPQGTYQYIRRCEKCSSHNVPGLPVCNGTVYASLTACQPSCNNQDCPPLVPTTPTQTFTGVPYSCVEDPSVTTPCDLPGGTGSPTYEVKGVKCLPCNCVMTGGGRVCTPNGVPVAGTPACPWPVISAATTCISHPNCKPEECPTVFFKGKCYEESRELCLDNENYEIINNCQTCKCWTDPSTSTTYCYRQAVINGVPQGPHNILDNCPLSNCNNDSCPDVDCATIFTQTKAGNIFA